MLSLLLAAILPSFTVAVPSNQCLAGGVDGQNCKFMCYDITIGDAVMYDITPDTSISDLSLDNLGVICPNIKLANEIYGGCALGDLIWDTASCSCPYCPCDTTAGEFTADETLYSVQEAFFERSCVQCTCKEKNAGQSDYGFDCWTYGGDYSFQMQSYTTAASYNAFECPPGNTCTDGNNWPIYMDGDGYFDQSKCDEFCYCDGGSPLCRNGYASILGTDDALRAAFINRCGEEIKGCLDPQYYGKLVSKPLDTAGGETCANSNQECPVCTCDTADAQWLVKAEDALDPTATNCLSCMCLLDDDGTTLKADCDVGERYRNDRLTCNDGSGTSCSFGVSADADRTASISATTQGKCPADYQCGWERKTDPFSPEVGNRWGCVDPIFCNVLGIDGTCVHTSGSVSPSYFGCSDIFNPFTWDDYLYCCSGDNCNAAADIPSDLTTCADNDDLTTMYTDLYTCFVGTGTTNDIGIPLNYDLLKCNSAAYKNLSSCFPTDTGYEGGWTYNMHDYIKWSYGCACGAVSNFYNLADDATKLTLLPAKEDVILSLAQFAGADPMSWMETLGCNIASVECDVESGDVYMNAKSCEAVMWNSDHGCIAQCFQKVGEGYEYQWFFKPQQELSFDIIQKVCPSVSAAVDAGLCTESDLIWPTDECGCPYCSCDAAAADDWIESTIIEKEYFFGRECVSACRCDAITDGYGVTCYGGFGDGEYPWRTPETFGSWEGYSCPPDLNSLCENHDNYYMPGQSFWDIDTAVANDPDNANAYYTDIFCICDPDGSGTAICEDGGSGYGAILGSDNTKLVNQFLMRCGEKLKGCLNAAEYSHIMTRGVLLNSDCPVCGCYAAEGTVSVVEDVDYSNPLNRVCRSCVCTGGTELSCDDGTDPYKAGTKTCPPDSTTAQSCYQGVSSVSGARDANFVGGKHTCEDAEHTYCGWEYQSMTIDEPSWKRTCQDRVMCEAFGITDGATCLISDQTLNFGLHCGALADMLGGTTEIQMVNAIGCCSGDDCNDAFDGGDFDITKCTTSADLDRFYSDMFGCLAGEGTWPWECPGGINGDDKSEVTCENIQSYLEFVKGCVCTTATNLYAQVTDATLKTYLEGKLQQFIDSGSGFGDQDATLWAENLGCNIDPAAECDWTTGTVYVKPSKCDHVNWYSGSDDVCMAQCINFVDADWGDYQWLFYKQPQKELSFDIIKSVCRNVSAAADAGICTESDLIWPTDECGCPYCECETEGWITDTEEENEWLFGRECSACYCTAENRVQCYESFGDGHYPFDSYQTIASWNDYSCPPARDALCENNDKYYTPGQSFWDVDAALEAGLSGTEAYYNEIFCICDPEGTGASLCVDGTGDDGIGAILASDNKALRNQFLIRCGDDLAGCLHSDYYDNIVSRTVIEEKCPVCGCGSASAGDGYLSEEVDFSDPATMVCRSCVCLEDGVECEDGKKQYDACPADNAKSCYQGSSTVSGAMTDFVGGKQKCEDAEATYCGWEYQHFFTDDPEWKRRCQDRVMCETFGINDGTCIITDQTFTFGFGCGALADYFGTDQVQMVNAIACCSDDDCNGAFNDGAFDIDACETNDAYDSFFNDFYGCIAGEGTWPWTCIEEEGDDTKGTKSEVTCENLKSYFEYVKGCACTAAKNLYAEASDDGLKEYLENKVQEFIDDASGFGDINADLWNAEMDCDWVASCDIFTGTLTVEVEIVAPETSAPTPAPTESEIGGPSGAYSHAINIGAAVWIGFIFYVMQ